MVLSTTIDFRFSSPYRRAFTADCSKLLKPFLGCIAQMDDLFGIQDRTRSKTEGQK